MWEERGISVNVVHNERKENCKETKILFQIKGRSVRC